MLRSLHWLLILTVVPGCFFSSDNAGQATFLPYGGNLPTDLQLDHSFQFTPSGDLSGVTFTLKGNRPSWLSLDPATGVLTGCPDEIAETGELTLEARKGDSTQVFGPFKFSVTGGVGDPFASSAWSIRNTSQASFAANGGMAGEDMHLRDALCLGYTGRGVKVAVSDTGLQVAHEDLRDNVLKNSSKDYSVSINDFTQDPGLTLDPDDLGDHGTGVAGIIASRRNNGLGAYGYAPEAGIAGLNFLSKVSDAALLDQIDNDFDIVNQSWGHAPPEIVDANNKLIGFNNRFFTVPTEYLAQLKYSATMLRGGKGVVIVRAAGNEYIAPYLVQRDGDGEITGIFGRPLNANFSAHNTSPYSIVVGAMNARGVKASYSSVGSCLWVSGLGGEYGSSEPAMITTDISGCDDGYSRKPFPVGFSPANPFDGGFLGNTSCNYVSSFNGTSSASPTVSGVVALMLQANPNLTFRDVKHILAMTADKVDAAFSKTGYAFPTTYVTDPNWITNAAGRHFHNWYGFGRVNAFQAVKMAKSYSSQLGAQRETVSANGTWLYDRVVSLPIADNNLTGGATDSVNVTENYAIEAVQVRVTLTHPLTGDLGIELTSPSGTKSQLITHRSAFNQANFANVLMLSNAFYGENSQGTWTVRVYDGIATNTGTLTNWKINILGHSR